MAISFVGVSTPVSVSAATSIDIVRPSGYAGGDFIVVALAFEGVAAGSGPYVDPSLAGIDPFIVGPASGWQLALSQAPSATGSALEVWVAITEGGAPTGHSIWNFYTAMTGVGVSAAYRNVLGDEITDGALRASTKDQWTGANPECPSVFAYARELVIACGAEVLQSPGFGDPTPSGWTTRTEAARSSSYSNVSAVIADKLITTDGNTGPIPFSATVSGSPKGSTGTLAVRPVDADLTATSPLIHVEYATA